MTDLFPVPESLSPRLKWLAAHKFITGEFPDGAKFAASKICIKTADTLQEAEIKLSQVHGIHHWTIEEFYKAGVAMPGKDEENWE